MTATTHGTWHGSIVLEDANGVGIIPILRLRSMAYHANQRDKARAAHDGRHYDRDVLNAAAEAHRTLGLVELDTCSACKDAPATEGEWCAQCCSAATAYDDRTNE